jgi:phage shock protein PspC (stress-responsive transcriptional regulator)
MKNPLTENALLAGVCTRLAHLFQCNVWALRVVFIVLLLVKTLWTVLAYAVFALVFNWSGKWRKTEDTAKEDAPLESPELASRSRRIDTLDRRFRDWEESLGPTDKT